MCYMMYLEDACIIGALYLQRCHETPNKIAQKHNLFISAKLGQGVYFTRKRNYVHVHVAKDEPSLDLITKSRKRCCKEH